MSERETEKRADEKTSRREWLRREVGGKGSIFKEFSSGDRTVYIMFSDSRQLGQPRPSQPQLWLRNGAAVRRETLRAGPSARTEAGALPPDRRREAGLGPPWRREAKGNSQVRERADADANFDRRNLPRRLQPAELKPASRPEPVSQGGSRRESRWSQAPDPRRQRGSPVREPLGECVCSGPGHQTTQPHPSGRKYVPPPPVGFKGQESYGVPGCVVERQFWGYSRESFQRGSRVSGQAHAATRNFSRPHGSNSAYISGQEYSNYNHGLRELSRAKNRQEQGCNGPSATQGLVFSTEVPHRELDCSRQRSLCWPGNDVTHVQNKCPSEEQGQNKDWGADKPKMSQAAVRDQIRQVVGDLEGVLGGLKKVHLEMKEVRRSTLY